MSYEAWSAIGGALTRLVWVEAGLFVFPILILALGVRNPAGAAIGAITVGAVGAVEAVVEAIGWLVKWLGLALVAVIAIVVVQRYVFGISITKLTESAIYLHAGLFMLSAGSTYLADGHVRVDLFYAKLSDRWKAATDLIGVYLFLIPLCWVMFDMSQGYVARAWRVMEGSAETDGLPLVFALKTLIPVTAVLIVAAGFCIAARAAFVLRKAPLPAHERHENVVG